MPVHLAGRLAIEHPIDFSQQRCDTGHCVFRQTGLDNHQLPRSACLCHEQGWEPGVKAIRFWTPQGASTGSREKGGWCIATRHRVSAIVKATYNVCWKWPLRPNSAEGTGIRASTNFRGSRFVPFSFSTRHLQRDNCSRHSTPSCSLSESRPTLNGVGTPDFFISRLDGWPACAPVNASPVTSRPPAHDSGSG